jgi:hypothetical protein
MTADLSDEKHHSARWLVTRQHRAATLWDKKERTMPSFATPQRHPPQPADPRTAPRAATKASAPLAALPDAASPAMEQSALTALDHAAARRPLVLIPLFRPDMHAPSGPPRQFKQSPAPAVPHSFPFTGAIRAPVKVATAPQSQAHGPDTAHVTVGSAAQQGERIGESTMHEENKPSERSIGGSVARKEWSSPDTSSNRANNGGIIQRKVGFEYEIGDIRTEHWSTWKRAWYPHVKGAVLANRNGYQVTADEGDRVSQLEMIIKEIDETSPVAVNNLLTVTIPDLTQVLTNIIKTSHGEWKGANEIPTLNGSSWDRLGSEERFKELRDVYGQLQMTGGIAMNRLADIASGRQADQYLTLHAAALTDSPFGGVIGKYLPTPPRTDPRVWDRARNAVAGNASLNGLVPADHEMIAAIVTLLATIPINARGANDIPYPKGTAGDLLARTDFSKILMLTPPTVKAALTAAVLTTLVITTINATLPPPAHPPTVVGDHVFPANNPTSKKGFAVGVPHMNQLTIGHWISTLMPTAATWSWGHWQGTDLLTKKNFPGKANRKWLESMGSYGSKVDPGNKAIFEFRNLSMVYADTLGDVLGHLMAYIQ